MVSLNELKMLLQDINRVRDAAEELAVDLDEIETYLFKWVDREMFQQEGKENGS